MPNSLIGFLTDLVWYFSKIPNRTEASVFGKFSSVQSYTDLVLTCVSCDICKMFFVLSYKTL